MPPGEPSVARPGVAATLSLAAIADLADVRRPVVSMWRRRHAGAQHPFPAPVSRAPDGRELFAAADVLAWLGRTGLGNNPTAAADAAVYVELGSPANASPDVAVHVLTALLTLKARTGVLLTGLSPAALLDLADDVDPDDAFLFTELDQCGDDLRVLARHADALADAAWSAPEALERVVQRHGGVYPPLAESALAPALVTLAARVARALVASSAGPAALVDTSGAGELLHAVASAEGYEAAPVLLAPATGGAALARLARRRLAAFGADVRDLPSDDDVPELPAGSLVVAHLPDGVTGPLSDDAVVAHVERLALAMHDTDRAVVVAPASALIRRSSSALAGARAEVLRTGRVRAIVRLPAGLRLARSREQMAMWVLAAPSAAAVDDRWIAVADLAGEHLSDDVIESVVADVAAACADRATARAHAFRFARLLPAGALQASTGDLVRTTAPVRRSRERPADTAVMAEHLAAVATRPLPAVPIDVTPAEFRGVRTVTLGALVADGAVRVVPGNRLDEADLVSGGDVPVHDPESLGRDGRPSRGIDRLTFSARYPSARYTEPGDVVVTSVPQPRAVVDTDGFAAVLTPARVLRVTGADPGLTPHLLAAAVRAAPRGASWRSWPVRLAPPDQAEALEVTLRAVSEALAAIAERRKDLHALAAALIEGVTAGGLTLNPTTEHDDALSRQRG